MMNEKNTTELLHDLEAAGSFGDYLQSSRGSLLSEEAHLCPYCSAPIHAAAAFCPTCMRPLSEKRTIPEKKHVIYRSTRLLLGFFLALLVIAAAAVLIPKALNAGKETIGLPSPEDFSELLSGATLGSEDWKVRDLWDTSAWAYEGNIDGCRVYSVGKTFTGSSARAVFSDDGKSLLFCLPGVPSYESGDAEKLITTVFSAVYRYYVENVPEIMEKDRNFMTAEAPDPKIAALSAAAGAGFSDGGSIAVSYPIRTARYKKAPCARICTVRSGDIVSYYCIFEAEDL